jgi:hypothetical protein
LIGLARRLAGKRFIRRQVLMGHAPSGRYALPAGRERNVPARDLGPGRDRENRSQLLHLPRKERGLMWAFILSLMAEAWDGELREQGLYYGAALALVFFLLFLRLLFA